MVITGEGYAFCCCSIDECVQISIFQNTGKMNMIFIKCIIDHKLTTIDMQIAGSQMPAQCSKCKDTKTINIIDGVILH